ncbi:MAG: hypothetical protein ACK53L_14065, partial [Pirellulaceae bacterium]
LYDSPIDDRDAGLLVTPKGTILVTNFTSLAYKPLLKAAEEAKPGTPGAFADPKLLEEWQAADRRLTDEQKVGELGCYMLRSTDGGLTWSAPKTIRNLATGKDTGYVRRYFAPATTAEWQE